MRKPAAIAIYLAPAYTRAERSAFPLSSTSERKRLTWIRNRAWQVKISVYEENVKPLNLEEEAEKLLAKQVYNRAGLRRVGEKPWTQTNPWRPFSVETPPYLDSVLIQSS